MWITLDPNSPLVFSATHALGPTQLEAPMDSNFSYVSQYILREFV